MNTKTAVSEQGAPYDDMDDYISRLSEPEQDELATADQAIDIALLLNQARLRRGLSQKEAAELAGVHQQAVSRIEGAHAPNIRIDTLRRYLGALGYDVELVIRERGTSDIVAQADILVGTSSGGDKLTIPARGVSEGGANIVALDVSGAYLQPSPEAPNRVSLYGIERNATVWAQDGDVGEVYQVVVDPDTKELTHIVVRPSGRGDILMIPTSMISDVTGTRITLNATESALNSMHDQLRYNEAQFQPVNPATVARGEAATTSVRAKPSELTNRVAGATAELWDQHLESSIGKTAGHDVYADDGTAIVVQGMVIDAMTVERARAYGKENQLIAAVGAAQTQEVVTQAKDSITGVFSGIRAKIDELSAQQREMNEE